MRLAIAAVFFAGAVQAGEPPCTLHNWPSFWMDSQARVQQLKDQLRTEEQKNPWSRSSAKAFQNSLKMCKEKGDTLYAGAGASNGASMTQEKCEALLVCARITAMQESY